MRDEHPHAAELLAFYDEVLALQEPLHAKALKSRWLSAVEAADGRAPRLRLELLPERSRERDFSRFVRAVPASATDVLRAMAERLMTEPAAMSMLLSAVLAREPVDAVAARIGCDAAALEFFPRAFVQPVAEALASQTDFDSSGDHDSGGMTRARHDCGAAPVVAVLEPEIKGDLALLAVPDGVDAGPLPGAGVAARSRG